MQITRKQFLERLFRGAAGLAGVAAVAACSDGTGRGDAMDPDAAPGSDAAATPGDAGRATSCIANGTIGAISGNHGHVLQVSKADVAAGTARTYDIRGSADHAHSVTVSAVMFTMLKSNTAIAMTSSSDSGHNHTVTVTCA